LIILLNNRIAIFRREGLDRETERESGDRGLGFTLTVGEYTKTYWLCPSKIFRQ
jgi:hypothetical protein